MARLFTLRSILAMTAALVGLLLGSSPVANADTDVATTSGQTLNLSIDGFTVDATSVTAKGYVAITEGDADIASITASWDGGTPERVALHSDGSFAPTHATMAEKGDLVVVATASDGTTVTEKASWDEADSNVVRTTTGQRMSITFDVRTAADGTVTGFGRALISAGSVTLASVQVTFGNGAPLEAELQPDGDFAVSKRVTARDRVAPTATATASDGTQVSTSLPLALPSSGNPQPPAAEPGDPRVAELPNTGPSGPRTLGPIGLAMVVAGSALVWRYRRTREV